MRLFMFVSVHVCVVLYCFCLCDDFLQNVNCISHVKKRSHILMETLNLVGLSDQVHSLKSCLP